jgi:hypothetical protein
MKPFREIPIKIKYLMGGFTGTNSIYSKNNPNFITFYYPAHLFKDSY